MIEAQNQKPSALERIFKWISWIGLWWGVISLLRHMRTPDLFLTQISQWLDISPWAMSACYAAWDVVKNAYLALVGPAFVILPWQLDPLTQNVIAIGWFFGMRLGPIVYVIALTAAWFGLFRASAVTLSIIVIATIVAILPGSLLTYLILCDQRLTWLSPIAGLMANLPLAMFSFGSILAGIYVGVIAGLLSSIFPSRSGERLEEPGFLGD